MSKTSKQLRSQAANELRESRNGGSLAEKAKNEKRAAAYKTLAQNEEWLEGEQSRPPKSSLHGEAAQKLPRDR
jgi:hypothetical protein